MIATDGQPVGPEKILVLADIHANLPALEAVFEAEGSWDEILFLGDAVQCGPWPNEVLDLLRGQQGLFIMGNEDRRVIECDLDREQGDPHWQWIQWTLEQISRENLDFLRSFQTMHVARRHRFNIRMLHSHEFGGVYPDDDPEFIEIVADQFAESLLLIGHSHLQFERRTDSGVVINPGGLGQPCMGYPVACYAVIEAGGLRLRAVPYDSKRTATGMDRIGLWDSGFVTDWKRAFTTGMLPPRYRRRDLTRLRAMGCR